MRKICLLLTVFFLTYSVVAAQKGSKTAKPATKAKSIIFAVLQEGEMIEPIAHIEGGKLLKTVDAGNDDGTLVSAFNKTYYKSNASYRLIFGGREAGTVSVKTLAGTMECAPNMSQVTLRSARAKLKGLVMALATNAPSAKPGSGMRRLPTAAERAEIESLVRAEFKKQKLDPKNLKYHNLTALDVDSDGTAEMVGTFWVEPSSKTRESLFFIADKNNGGKYSLGFSELENIKEEDLMDDDISIIDRGVYHELLLDIFDYDGDGVSEVFTFTAGFEGAGFNAYRRHDGKWVRVFEGSNYHCGY